MGDSPQLEGFPSLQQQLFIRFQPYATAHMGDSPQLEGFPSLQQQLFIRFGHRCESSSRNSV